MTSVSVDKELVDETLSATALTFLVVLYTRGLVDGIQLNMSMRLNPY